MWSILQFFAQTKCMRWSSCLDVEWVQFFLQKCEKLQNYGFKYGKEKQILFEVFMIKNRHTGIALFSSDFMYKLEHW